jgi:hypothetical protein
MHLFLGMKIFKKILPLITEICLEEVVDVKNMNIEFRWL